MASALLVYGGMRCLLLACALAACTQGPGAGPNGSTVDTAVITRTGGLAPSPPAGSECTTIDETFNYDAPSGMLSWKICQYVDASTPNRYTTGHRTLDTARADQLDTELADLHASAQACGGDISDRIVLTTASGTQTYDSAQCYDGEAALLADLDSLAQ